MVFGCFNFYDNENVNYEAFYKSSLMLANYGPFAYSDVVFVVSSQNMKHCMGSEIDFVTIIFNNDNMVRI